MNTPTLTPEQRLQQIGDALDNLQRRRRAVEAELAKLEKAGIINAKPYWRPDGAGKRTLLYLIHPSDHGQRQREYIGKDSKKQKAALAAIERYRQHRELAEGASQASQAIAAIERAITDLHSEANRRASR
jgi:hypothetical protein